MVIVLVVDVVVVADFPTIVPVGNVIVVAVFVVDDVVLDAVTMAVCIAIHVVSAVETKLQFITVTRYIQV